MVSWVLDSVGDWRRKTAKAVGGSELTEIRQHNSLHQITRIGSTDLSYDAAGNLIDDGTRSYLYDAFNRLVQVTRKSDTLIIAYYLYDAGGRRVRKTVTNGGLSGTLTDAVTDYLYDSLRCIEERSSSDSPTRQYVWGLYVDELVQLREIDSETTDDYYVLSDLLHRTAALTDASGEIVETYDYDAYGRTRIYNSSGTSDGTWFTDEDIEADEPQCRYLFTGREYDAETQLYFYRARSYSPDLGRFLQRDPIMYVDWMNLYEYAQSNASKYLDMYGETGNDPNIDKNKKTCCEREVKKHIKKAKIKKIRDAIEKKGCKKIEPSCEECKENQTLGYYNGSEIVICYNNMSSKATPYYTLFHEYIHAYDDCYDIGGESSICASSACTEIRAYDVDGTCRKYRNDKDKHEDCIKKAAAGSVRSISYCTKDAMKYVEAMWDTCYRKLQLPFEWPV